MTDREALLAAILACPADDTPRAVFADYVRERGEAAYADCIEAQLELARLPECGHRPKRDVAWWTGTTCDRCRLWQVSERFLMSDAAKPVRQLPWGLAPRGAVERGFLATVRCSAEQWAQYGDAALSRHPVTSVTLTTEPVFRHGPLDDAEDEFRFVYAGRIVALTAGEFVSGKVRWLVPGKRWPGVTFTLPV